MGNSKKNGNFNKMNVMKRFIGFLASATMFVLLLASCGISVDEIEGEIVGVHDGNTIELDVGTIVHLRGIKSSSSFTQKSLESMVGKTVKLQSDIADEEYVTIESYDEEIYAYAVLHEDGSDLGETLLKSAKASAFDATNCYDFHLDEYKELIKEDVDPELNTIELSARLKTASMLVQEPKGDGKSSIGTAFFVGNDGLALSNNHVVNYGNYRRCNIFMSDINGNIDYDQPYQIKRVVHSDEKCDYTIFYVDMDPTSMSRILPLKLTKDKEYRSGTAIGVVGNPAPGSRILTMSFATGEIARVQREEGKIQINAPITNGFSGGPAANQKGHAIGICQGGYVNNNANLNFAVDIRIVRDKLEDLCLPYAGK